MGGVPQPQLHAAGGVGKVIRQVALLSLREGASAERAAALERALAGAGSAIAALSRSQVGRHLAGSVCADYTWDACFTGTAPPLEALLAEPCLAPFFDSGSPDAVVAATDAVRFAPQSTSLPVPGLRDFVKRTLFLRVLDDTPEEVRERFEGDLRRMPAYVSTIRNWALSRSDPALQPTPWTHVFEQEFDDVEGLQGEYMVSPFHWGYIDGWFDPECPQRIVDTHLAHVFCSAPTSILAWTAEGA